MAARVWVGDRHNGEVKVEQQGGAAEAVRRFRDLREDMRDRFDFEVTNEFVLNYVLDVHDLHWERENR